MKRKVFKLAALGVLLVAIVTAVFFLGDYMDERTRLVTKESIRRAMINCYALEGAYPDSLKYLEENYGVWVDYKRFDVTYKVVAPNMLPQVEVRVRGQKEL